jgi:hypothetical protein
MRSDNFPCKMHLEMKQKNACPKTSEENIVQALKYFLLPKLWQWILNFN